MHAAAGVLTERGGSSSHAAVIARGLGLPCVVGASGLSIGPDGARAGGRALAEGDPITIDGTRGEALAGHAPLLAAAPGGAMATLLDWADAARDIGVRANADTPRDARLARSLGAEGIGLCRTEHLVFEDDRLTIMRRDDLRRDRGGPPRRARAPAAAPARRLPRDLPHRGGRARLPAPVRPAAARVPAGLARGAARARRGAGPALVGGHAPRRGAERGEPHAGHARRAPGHRAPRDLRHAGPRGLRGGRRRGRRGPRRGPRDHDPARHRAARGRARARAGGRRGLGRAGRRRGRGSTTGSGSWSRRRGRRSGPTRSRATRPSSASAPTT